MSNARNTAKLINKFSPTASGIDLTGNLGVSGETDFTGDLNLGTSAKLTGGVSWYMPLQIWEASNSVPVSSSSSSLTMDDHTFTIRADGVNSSGSANIEIMAWCNVRYLEDSDDPIVRARLQMYNYGTSAWASITDSDGYNGSRHADRGSANYNRFTVPIWGTLQAITTSNYLGPNNEVRVRLYVDGSGGTSNDDLDAYWVSWRLTQWSRS